MTSPFLQVPPSDWVASNDLAFAVRDRFPVAEGHTLVVPRRLVASWFEATREERVALVDLVDEVRRLLDSGPRQPDGYNVGVNVGPAAGQTVMHLHVHVIPRYAGDVPDPRGGVRHVIPGRGNYLLAPGAPLVTGGTSDPFIGHLAPLWARATEVAIVAAFVQDSGLEVLRVHAVEALRRGCTVRLVTGDYLDITQAAALERLLDWGAAHGNLAVRVVETSRLPPGGQAFHPKSWRFTGPGADAAYVGSSNVSRSALQGGVEWNLRLDPSTNPDGWRALDGSFEHWWSRGVALTPGWVAAYAARARAPVAAPGDAEPEPAARAPEPHRLQLEALEALRESREDGRTRACVVLATGLGKTLLAALDVAAFARREGRLPRVLLLAHREELLDQAARTFRLVLRGEWPRFTVSWFVGERGELDGDLVVASVQKLVRPEHLGRLEPRVFDYVIVDEVHHAAAASYRKVLDRLEPGFLLGLTATPERTDGADVLGLFDDHLAYRADLGAGIAHELLAPFAYLGLKDDVDYAAIPRDRSFDPEALQGAVETERRMEKLWEAWRERPGTRTLVFCCSVHHAEFARDWLARRGVRVAAVHSRPGSDERTGSIEALRRGELDAVCAVDVLNEGVDIPEVDRVVMLRPTESMVVFLQQLGRGLRRAPGKARVTVIDFVGNHRVFLTHVHALLSLESDQPVSLLRGFLAGEDVPLPPGCSVDLELEAKDLLQRLLPAGASEVERVYRELLAERGVRPTAGELQRMGYRPGTVRERHGGWFDFVAAAGGMSEAERRVLEAARPWLSHLERTELTKCFKLVLLEALIEAGALDTGLELAELARRSHAILLRSPELRRDIEGVKELPDPLHPGEKRWLGYWNDNPVAAWTGRDRKKGQAWFRLEQGRFVPRLPVPPGDRETFVEMTRELVDWGLARYRARHRPDVDGSGAGSFEAVVLSNRRDPILKIPREGRPEGEVDVRLPDGTPWVFRLVKEYCNVARPVASQRNELPDLLRRWFGPAAGARGTGFRVRFWKAPDGWCVEPEGGKVVPLAPRGSLVAYPDLRAAAGAASAPRAEAPEAEEVRLPTKTRGAGVFAVRATGDSMDGGERPVRDGDWLVLRWARGAGLGAVEGRVALVQVPDEHEGFGYQVKRVVRERGRWALRSDNPARPSFPASEATVPIALVEDVVRPEDVGPRPGTRLADGELGKAFGLTGPPRAQGRTFGHLFALVEERGAFVAPDRLRFGETARRPGETLFVLARADGAGDWLHVGVGRWLEAERLWATPELDFATWRALGAGRSASRRLPEGALARARAVAGELFARHPPGSSVEHGGRRCRIVGPAPGGGVRIDGGPGQGGFAERTVSLTDLAWVGVAEGSTAAAGAALDEVAVNRVRYLAGTPKASTRFIDTGWALVLWWGARG